MKGVGSTCAKQIVKTIETTCEGGSTRGKNANSNYMFVCFFKAKAVCTDLCKFQRSAVQEEFQLSASVSYVCPTWESAARPCSKSAQSPKEGLYYMDPHLKDM